MGPVPGGAVTGENAPSGAAGSTSAN
jgi:hypothetical protein